MNTFHPGCSECSPEFPCFNGDGFCRKARMFRTPEGSLITNLSALPECEITRMQSADGFWQFIEGRAYVGKRYKYSPASRGVRRFRNEPSDTPFACDTVFVYDDSNETFQVMPVECLKFIIP